MAFVILYICNFGLKYYIMIDLNFLKKITAVVQKNTIRVKYVLNSVPYYSVP